MDVAEEVHGRLAALFREKLNVEVPSVDTDLYETGILDSMAFVELLAFLEKEFQMRLELNEIEIDNFKSIEKITEFVLRTSRPVTTGLRENDE